MHLDSVLHIVKDYLERRPELDGLCADGGDCACLIEDLAPCGEMQETCVPGHKVDGCSDDCGEGCDWHIVMGPREPK